MCGLQRNILVGKLRCSIILSKECVPDFYAITVDIFLANQIIHALSLFAQVSGVITEQDTQHTQGQN